MIIQETTKEYIKLEINEIIFDIQEAIGDKNRTDETVMALEKAEKRLVELLT